MIKKLLSSLETLKKKQKQYEQLLISMLTDQWNWIKDHKHRRVIDDSNAIESLRIAVDAKEMAQKF